MKLYIIIFLLFCGISYGFAQRTNSTDSLQHLEEVLVSADAFKPVIPVHSLSGERLQSLEGHSVADALRFFSGVQVKDYGGLGGLKTIDIRNMGSQHVGVFYDGVELGNAQNGVVDLGRFSLDDMASVSMYNGQKSDIFQSARDFASASTIYLTSLRPYFRSGEKNRLIVRYKIMSVNYNDPSFRWEHKFSDKLSLSLSSEMIRSSGRYRFRYKRYRLDGTIAYDTTAIRQNSDIEAFRLESGLYGNIPDGKWEEKLYYYDSDRGAPGAIIANKFSDGFRQYDKNFFTQFFLVKDFSRIYKFQLRAKYAYDYLHYVARDTTNVLGETVTEGTQSDDSYYQQEAYLSTVHLFTILPVWNVSFSSDLQWNKLDAVRRGIHTLFSYPTRYTGLFSIASSLDIGSFKAMASLVGSYVHETVRYNARPADKKVLAPALFLAYKPFKAYDFNVRAFAKRIFRMPTFNDLYYLEVGSATLKPEYMNQYDAGFTYQKSFRNDFLDRISFQADGYYVHTRDKIVAAPTSNLFRWTMSNIGNVRGKGIETSLSGDMHIEKLAFSAILNYAYSQMRDYTKVFGLERSSYGDQIPYTPWNSGSAIANASWKLWTLDYSFIYVGKRYNANVNNIKANEVQPWYTHDLSLGRKFLLKTTELKAEIQVNNLLDQQYEVITNYPMPGRTFRLIISMEI